MYKIYFDTNVFNQLFADDRPDWKEATERLWEFLQKSVHKLFISPVVLEEIDAAQEEKRGRLYEKMALLNPEVLEDTDDVTRLADEYIKEGILSEKWKNDCLHIAYAVFHKCDVIISYNFKHLINPKRLNRINEVNSACGYGMIAILTASDFLELEDV
jgi:predicted nucleic acid-binding protein